VLNHEHQAETHDPENDREYDGQHQGQLDKLGTTLF
jgi:hypothetical protein